MLRCHSELAVKVVNTKDMKQVLYLRDQPKPIKHVTFDRSGTILAASCSDGNIYFYSLSSEEPQLLKKLEGVIKPLETDAEASSRVVWHPSGAAFGVPTQGREFQVMSRSDWSKVLAYSGGHSSSDISAAEWSPNAALLVTTSVDRKFVLWDAKTQQIIKTYDPARATILKMHGEATI